MFKRMHYKMFTDFYSLSHNFNAIRNTFKGSLRPQKKRLATYVLIPELLPRPPNPQNKKFFLFQLKGNNKAIPESKGCTVNTS